MQNETVDDLSHEIEDDLSEIRSAIKEQYLLELADLLYYTNED